MPELVTSQRRGIRKAIFDLIDKAFGPKGEVEPYFRETHCRQWMPGGAVRPALNVGDDGQRVTRQFVPGSGELTDGSEDRTLNIRIIIDLEEDWSRPEQFDAWVDRIEQLVALVTNRLQTGFGILRIRYVSDDPFTAVWGEGNQQDIWVIDFEADYFVEAPAG